MNKNPKITQNSDGSFTYFHDKEFICDVFKVLTIRLCGSGGYTEDNMPDGCEDLLHFMNYYWYVPSTDEFIFIGEAPNKHATWSNELGGWEFNREDLINDVRVERNRKLSLTDWTQVTDSPLTEEQRIEWKNYRQSLRDVTDNLGVILSTAEVNWPTTP